MNQLDGNSKRESANESGTQARSMNRPPIGPLSLFVVFSKVTLCGFGGVMFWMRRALVERKQWLTVREFGEFLALGQVLPGPPGLNISVMVGYRFAGVSGAAASLAGFLGWPCLVIVGMGVIYQHYGALPAAQRALAGMAAVAVGLLLETAIKVAVALPRRWLPSLFVVLTFLGIGFMRWPFLWVVGALTPFTIAATWKERSK